MFYPGTHLSFLRAEAAPTVARSRAPHARTGGARLTPPSMRPLESRGSTSRVYSMSPSRSSLRLSMVQSNACGNTGFETKGGNGVTAYSVESYFKPFLPKFKIVRLKNFIREFLSPTSACEVNSLEPRDALAAESAPSMLRNSGFWNIIDTTSRRVFTRTTLREAQGLGYRADTLIEGTPAAQMWWPPLS